jgi:heme oxygenase
MALRDLLKDIHNEAENTEFATLLMSGNMSPELYGLYLNQQFHIYSALENRAYKFPFYLDNLRKMGRMMQLETDRVGYVYPDKILPTAKKYIKYCGQLREDQVIAHLYVRHFGDMYGGNMIQKKIPKCNRPSEAMHTEGLYYLFEEKKENISIMRNLLNDDMADECKIVFQYAIDLFKELMDYDIPEAYISSIGSPGVAGIKDGSQATA